MHLLPVAPSSEKFKPERLVLETVTEREFVVLDRGIKHNWDNDLLHFTHDCDADG